MITVGDQRIYSKAEVCEMFKICPDTLMMYIRQKRIKAVKFGSTSYISEETLKTLFGLREETRKIRGG